VDEKLSAPSRSPQKGINKAEKFFNIENLADAENATLAHHINQAMRAHGIMKRDIDYVVKDGQVHHRRRVHGPSHAWPPLFNEGLHQAIEAKEGVSASQKENKTLATITFQNFFPQMLRQALRHDRHRPDRGSQGIRGPSIGMDVVEIPTNMPVIRLRIIQDAVYKNDAGQIQDAVVEQVKEMP
jgi:preprotein translocase subunit SecA